MCVLFQVERRVLLFFSPVYLYVCVCVCVCARERERETGRVLNSQTNDTPPFSVPEACVLISWDCSWLGLNHYVCFQPFGKSKMIFYLLKRFYLTIRKVKDDILTSKMLLFNH